MTARSVALTLLLSGLVLSARAAEPYRIVGRLAPGGEGGWDYLVVDSAARRLYVSRSTRVQVIDLRTGQLAGEIPDTEGVHGIALASDLGVGFTSNGRAGSVTVFELASLKTVGAIKIDGQNPDAILYEPVSKRVFTFNGGSANATAIDARSRSVVGVVALPGKPEYAVADGSGKVFVNIEDKSVLVLFDARTLKVDRTSPLTGCEEPTGLAIDRENGRLFAGCHNQVMTIVDARSGRVVSTIPIDAGVDGAAFDAERKLAFTSNGAGTVTVVREDGPDKFTKIADVPTQRSARTISLDESTHRLYLPAASFGEAPAPTAAGRRPRPPMTPGSFAVLVLAPAS